MSGVVAAAAGHALPARDEVSITGKLRPFEADHDGPIDDRFRPDAHLRSRTAGELVGQPCACASGQRPHANGVFEAL